MDVLIISSVMQNTVLNTGNEGALLNTKISQ